MGRLIKSLAVIAALVGIVIGLYFVAPARTDPLASANEAIDRRDFTTARELLDRYLAQNPNDKDGLFLAARSARRDGDGATGEAYLQRYLDAGGNDEDAQLERVLRESQEGNVANADRVFAHCTQNPDDPNASLMIEALARGLLKVGPPTKTIECVDLWLSRSISQGDRVQAIVWRGRALQQMGLAPEAAEEFQTALAIDETKSEARLLLAQFQTRHEPESALAHFRRLERERPGDKEVQFGLARCHRQLGDLDAAGVALKQLLANHPDDVPILIESAMLALDRGRPDEAEVHLRRALVLQPKSRDANTQLARCLQEMGREKEAKEQMERAKKIEEEIFDRLKEPARKP